MAMQLPVVATDVGGTNEVVQGRRTGLLVPARDPAPLAQAILHVLGDPAEAAAMGERGRAVAIERFSARAMVRRMEELYVQLWQARGLRETAEAPLPGGVIGG
jgi:glycosyltransferase involved in cell wall biosynthesis